jgi:hypothetical protein
MVAVFTFHKGDKIYFGNHSCDSCDLFKDTVRVFAPLQGIYFGEDRRN